MAFENIGETEKISLHDRLAEFREDAGRIAGRLLLATGLTLGPTVALLAETELPAEAAATMRVTGPNSEFTVTTECDNNSKYNTTLVDVASKKSGAAEAVLKVGNRDVILHFYNEGRQRHNFATVENNMPITLSSSSPDSVSNTMTNDCRHRSDKPVPSGGYTLASRDGGVRPFGLAPDLAGPDGYSPLELTDIESTPPEEDGYYLTFSNGSVFSFNGKRIGNLSLPDRGERVESTSVTTSGKGLWRFTDKGGVLLDGDAIDYGGMKGTPLNGPVLDSKRTTSGKGYWMIASDGGVFSFGDARFYGSMGDRPLNKPVVGMAPDPDGAGYWLVAADGGIFAFDAPFRGSMGGKPLNKPVIGAVAYGDGYLMIAEDGGVFNFSNKPFEGSLGDNPPTSPVVDIAPVPPPR